MSTQDADQERIILDMVDRFYEAQQAAALAEQALAA